MIKKETGKPQKRLVVYTAIFGGGFKLITPTFISKGIDFVCFTDNADLKSEIWDIKYVASTSIDLARSAKIYKILPHIYFSDYKYSIWVDGNVLIRGDVNKLLEYLVGDINFVAYSHSQSIPSIDCIYCKAIHLFDSIEKGEYISLDKKTIEKQISRLHRENYPLHGGLIAGMVLVRKHNEPSCIKNMNDWWIEIQNGSSRDELSFNYVAWKNKFNFSYIPGYCCENEFFINKKHIKIG